MPGFSFCLAFSLILARFYASDGFTILGGHEGQRLTGLGRSGTSRAPLALALGKSEDNIRDRTAFLPSTLSGTALVSFALLVGPMAPSAAAVAAPLSASGSPPPVANSKILPEKQAVTDSKTALDAATKRVLVAKKDLSLAEAVAKAAEKTYQQAEDQATRAKSSFLAANDQLASAKVTAKKNKSGVGSSQISDLQKKVGTGSGRLSTSDVFVSLAVSSLYTLTLGNLSLSRP